MINYNNLTQLGSKIGLPNSPDEAIIEKIENPHLDVDYVIRFTAPEFTSLCPITAQPDFAYIIIDYVPDKYIIESKSLKLFLGSFRNHGDFHEACTIYIAKKIEKALMPKWLKIGGYWYARGGISLDIFYENGELPKNISVPDQNVSNLKGRG